MLDIQYKQDEQSGEEWIETSLSGKALLTTPQLNKGTAFTPEERRAFDLIGKLPVRIETLDEQLERAYQQYCSYRGNLKKNIFLNELHDNNQTLFYRLASKHLADIMPKIYTPIVGSAVKSYSLEFRQPRGLFISYPDRDHIEEILDNRSNPDVDIIVVTDGEGVLGIGDQGVGSIDIPVAKLMVYTLCGGINSTRTLPILLDVGTDNEALLNDPLYLGWRQKRIRGQQYDDFIEKFVTAIKKKFHHIFLHWEDFGRENARKNLERFRNTICSFNDDMQGTAAVTLAAILSALAISQTHISEQRVVIFGAGTAGMGICDKICDSMVHEGLSLEEARSHFWLMDRPGLLHSELDGLTESQQPYARNPSELSNWQHTVDGRITLDEVVKKVKPTILIGCSAMTDAFSQSIIQNMAAHTEHPIILPLSNPTERCEATPQNIIDWTKGKALIATGSPFEPITFGDRQIPVAQCNNALVFPGIGLAVVAVKAQKVSEEMLWQASTTLAKCSPAIDNAHAPLLPTLNDARKTAYKIALAVAKQAINEGHGQAPNDKSLESHIKGCMWEPHYLPYRRP